jgi:hypothetical protein
MWKITQSWLNLDSFVLQSSGSCRKPIISIPGNATDKQVVFLMYVWWKHLCKYDRTPGRAFSQIFIQYVFYVQLLPWCKRLLLLLPISRRDVVQYILSQTPLPHVLDRMCCPCALHKRFTFEFEFLLHVHGSPQPDAQSRVRLKGQLLIIRRLDHPSTTNALRWEAKLRLSRFDNTGCRNVRKELPAS